MQYSPKEFVQELDKKVIGQEKAKKVLAVAVRNRWRRSQLSSDIKKDITPKNVLMIGPTGVGKTAIMKAIADILDAPMVKVEATKFTQVGYVGGTVNEMIYELAEEANRKLNKGSNGRKTLNDSNTFGNNDFIKNIFKDLNLNLIGNIEPKKDNSMYTKETDELVETFQTSIIEDIFPIAVKYGYDEKKKKDFFTNKSDNPVSDDFYVFDAIWDFGFKNAGLMALGYLPNSQTKNEALIKEINESEIGDLLNTLKTHLINPSVENVVKFDKLFFSRYDKVLRVDTLMENFYGIIENEIDYLNAISRPFRSKVNRKIRSSLDKEVFKIAKSCGYDNDIKNILSNRKGFYTSKDLNSITKKYPSIYEKKLFSGTLDHIFLSSGIVPLATVKGLKGNEKKEKLVEYSKLIKEGYKKSKTLEYMVSFSVSDDYSIQRTALISILKELNMDLSIRNLNYFLWNILSGQNSDFIGLNQKVYHRKKPWNDRETKKENTSVVKLIHEKGIIFIDEIDKLASGKTDIRNDNIGKIGVQRDLLALLDGTVIDTMYGRVNTENILFVAAGAFHLNEVSDLMPELLGRLPIHVKLDDIDEESILQILKETENSPLKQYKLLLKTEGVDVKLIDDAIDEIAKLVNTVNKRFRNMGARTIHLVLERVFNEVSFDSFSGNGSSEFLIDRDYVLTIKAEMMKEFNSEYFKKVFKEMSGIGNFQ